jgi:hypothetical protein
MSKILIVLSAASTWTRADGSKYDSGVWAEEFVVMHETFVRAGCDVDIATPGGVTPTIDPHSMNPDVVGHEQVDHFRKYLGEQARRISQQGCCRAEPLGAARDSEASDRRSHRKILALIQFPLDIGSAAN